MTDDTGLVSAIVLDGDGGGRTLDWAGVRAWHPTDGFLWVHLDRGADEAQRWLEEESSVSPIVRDALLTDIGNRPRSQSEPGGVFVNLRGANLNPGSEPEDMVTVRVWLEPGRAITARRRLVAAVQYLRDALTNGLGPRDGGDILVSLANNLANRIGPVITALDDELAELEGEVLSEADEDVRPRLAKLRRRTIRLRRYIAPERDALASLVNQPADGLADDHRRRLVEIANRVTRYVEDLDAARERAQVNQEEMAMRLNQEEMAMRLSEKLNRNTYILSVVAALLLPPTFIAGLLGVNLGGIPGTDYPWAFSILCGAFVIAIAIQAWLFRRLDWI